MFPEMEDEFNVDDYESEKIYQLDEFIDENDHYEYEFEKEYPYGTISYSILVRKKGVTQSVDDEEVELKPIISAEEENVIPIFEPEPISLEQ